MPPHAGWHLTLSLVAIPLLVAVCLGMPLAPVLLLWRHRSCLKAGKVRHTFGFLYSHLRPGFFFWEGVVLAQTMLLVAAVAFSKAQVRCHLLPACALLAHYSSCGARRATRDEPHECAARL